LLDVINSLVLPSWLLWWGQRWIRVDAKRLQGWLLAYAAGALLFLVAALLKTRGLDWWLPNADPGTLFLAWGNEPSMNIRSVEQNGILAVALAPFSGWLMLHRRRREGALVLALSFVGWLAVVVLGGRLWIPSLLLASIPLFVARVLYPGALIALHNIRRFRHATPIALFGTVAAGVLASTLPTHWFGTVGKLLCDERFPMYLSAFRHWPELFAGGRMLRFDYYHCDGLSLIPYSAAGDSLVTSPMLHSVLLDVMVSVGLRVALPLALAAAMSLVLSVGFVLNMINAEMSGELSSWHLVLWSFVAVLVPQWLFQPLLYGDGLLYYLSFAVFGALVASRSLFAPTWAA